MLYIKWKGMEHRAPGSTNSVLTHTLDPWGGVNGHNIILLKLVMLHFKLKGKE